MTARQKRIDHFPHLCVNKIKDIDTGSRASEILTTQNLSTATAAICRRVHAAAIASSEMCALSPEVWEYRSPCVLLN